MGFVLRFGDSYRARPQETASSAIGDLRRQIRWTSAGRRRGTAVQVALGLFFIALGLGVAELRAGLRPLPSDPVLQAGIDMAPTGSIRHAEAPGLRKAR